jgi:hypothetical protein
VLFFDSNKNFHAHPNKEIGNGGHFLSTLDLEFSIQFISELKFLHPDRPQKEFVGDQPFIAANKTKLNLKLKTTDAPRKTHNA